MIFLFWSILLAEKRWIASGIFQVIGKTKYMKHRMLSIQLVFILQHVLQCYILQKYCRIDAFSLAFELSNILVTVKSKLIHLDSWTLHILRKTCPLRWWLLINPKLHVWWPRSSKAPIIASYDWLWFHVMTFLIMIRCCSFHWSINYSYLWFSWSEYYQKSWSCDVSSTMF